MRRARAYVSAVWEEVFPSCVRAELAEAGSWEADGKERYCPRCGASAGPHSVTARGCAFCVDRPIAWDRITRLSAYAEPVDGWIKAMKFGRQWSWGPWLGERLAGVVGSPFDDRRVVVCPVPMPWRRRWSRGFNQAALIAEGLAAARGWPLVDLLRRTRHTVPQTRVASSRRAANIRGSLAARPIDLAGFEVVLVDDVKTTGATLTVCARLLKRAGARSVRAAVAAVADPKGQGFRGV